MAFQVDEHKLLEMYNLNELNPADSVDNDWQRVSTIQYDLGAWQDSGKMLEERPYALLSDLIAQQKGASQGSRGLQGGIDASTVNDPLDGQLVLEKMRQLRMNPEQAPQYLVNSKNFDAIQFLRGMHNRDSFDELSQYLDRLDRELQTQAGDLQHLVQTNFTKYVKIKSRLDQIYSNFSEGGEQENQNIMKVEKLKEELDETIRFTTQKLNPVINYEKKINNFKLTKRFIEENKFFINLPKQLKSHLIQNNYNKLITDYLKGKEQYDKLVQYFENKVVAEFHDNEEESNINKTPKVIEVIWSACQSIVEIYKSQLWRLITTPSVIGNANKIAGKQSSEIDISIETPEMFLPNISRLLDLNIDENPIIKWIESRIDYLETKLRDTAQNMILKITNAQQNIIRNQVSHAAETERDTDAVELEHYTNIDKLFSHGAFMKKGESGDSNNNSNTMINSAPTFGDGTIISQGLTDSIIVIEMWLLILKYAQQLNELSARFIQLWEHTEKFLDGSYQTILINEKRKENILLVGDFNASEKYQKQIHLSDDEVKGIRLKGESFVKMIADRIFILFQSSQSSLSQFTSEDVSMDDMTWEKEIGLPSNYGFIPPNANGLSCLRYLPLIIEPILRFSSDLAQLKITPKSIEIPKKLASIIIGRSVSAISSTKLRDIANFHKLENWEKYEFVNARKDDLNDSNYEYAITQFPTIIKSFQELSIKTIRDIVFSFEKLPTIGGVSIIEYPSKKVLTGIEIQQIISMEAVLESILKNAAKDKDNPRNPHTILTLTNLQCIRESTFPDILQFFDDCFECNLKTKNLELFNLLAKMEQSIFGNYLSDLKISLRDTLESKFNEIDWATYTSTSFRAGDYIIESLMVLVSVHSECSRDGPQLIDRILRESHIFIARYLFESFKPFIGNISADGLLQVTVDIQFFQRVLGRLLDKDTESTLGATLQNCFQNNAERLKMCIKETEPIVNANLKRTSIQFSAFK
ncbi:Exocyst complex component SEC5 [Nakaseomyces glabratus]|uniref:Exocyst complex component SEC5 n=1 Tax=Candida glabrata TaxID=5478 RepID=A0A0W0DQZ9_CANGB|nr:Exocyst complex component SEC5 [Nakaseomyces glabratus]KTA97856.1 Exocyst complex component SEC5 [Nakaseomyces glabratus]KTA98833.1 Exocyst complex component SEC5 [Nakaseomyces glabratus]KTB02028.1 Exocyst complex component SEC5 [Nakaseomyces glabratus]KTB13677.1 Exocyst complex component SEC5 [Nakaseomyces glabratus]